MRGNIVSKVSSPMYMLLPSSHVIILHRQDGGVRGANTVTYVSLLVSAFLMNCFHDTSKIFTTVTVVQNMCGVSRM